MKKFISGILTALLLIISAAAQNRENSPELFDEYGPLGNCDISARVAALAVQLGENPRAKGLVRVYGGDKNYPGRAFWRGSLIKSLWSNELGLSRERISVEFCNVNQEALLTRVFIVGENDRVEPCAENLPSPAATALFDNVYFAEPDFKLVPVEDSNIDLHAEAQGEYSRFAQDALKRLLSASPESRVYLVGYLKTNFERDLEGKFVRGKVSLLDKKALAAKMLQSAKDNLLKNGFAAAQIEMIDGGYINDSRRVEYWFVPASGEIPKPKPEYIPKKRK